MIFGKKAERSVMRLFRASPTPFLVLAPDAPSFTITEVNDAYLAATMRTREALIGRALFEAFPDNPADLDADGVSKLRASLERVLATRGTDAMPTQKYDIARPDGGFEQRWWDPVNSAILDEDGEVEALIHHVNDVTTQRQADAALHESERELRFTLKAGRFGAWTLDVATGELTTSETCRTNFGRDPAEPFTYAELTEAIHPDDRTRMVSAVDESLATGADYDIDYRIVTPGGEVRWVLIRAQPSFDRDGAPLKMTGVSIDVTARKRDETRKTAFAELSDAIRDVQNVDELGYAASEILGRALGVSRVGYATIDPDAETLHVARDWNAPGVESLAGVLQLRDYGSFIDSLKRGEFISIADVRQDERTAPATEALESRSARSFVNMPVIERGRLGAVLYVNHALARVWSEEDLALVRDIGERTRTAMERLRAEHALRRLNETLEQRVTERTAERDNMWDTSPDLMLAIDFKGVFQRVNPAWTRTLGYAPEELIGHHVNAFVIPDDHGITVEAYEFAATGGRPAVENRYRHKNGSIRWISWVAAPAGETTYAIGRDVTSEKAREAELALAQDQLRQSQKMEAMGSLTGGVAHDFNNLLTPIVGALDMLQRKGLGGEREQRLIAGAIQSADRAKTLVQRLLAFARRQPLQATGIDLTPLIRGMADLVSSTTGPQIKVVVDAAEGLPPAKADPNQLEMAILNLAVNARDAMPEGGVLRISVDAETVGRQHRTDLTPGRYLVLSVSDTGSGMDEATLKRAIEPFFSTKGVGKGTGLGLSMVHGLASQLGGALTIRSTPRMGTNVELWLPQSAEPLEIPEPAADLVSATKGSGTALLVDDEDIVRLSTADMLIELGYTVVEAASAEEALKLVDRGLRPDLIITDHLMPGMSGTEFARTLQTRRPSAKVLIVSGYADAEGIAPDLPRLTKPFRSADLAASIAALN